VYNYCGKCSEHVIVPLVKFTLNCWIACAFYHIFIYEYLTENKDANTSSYTWVNAVYEGVACPVWLVCIPPSTHNISTILSYADEISIVPFQTW